MTATLTRPPPSAPGPPTPRRRRRLLRPLLVAAALAVLAFAVRTVARVRGFELWADEALYAELGASLARGELPRLADGLFFLHPPGMFVLEAAAIRLSGLDTGDSMALVFELRWLPVVLGALSVGLAYLIVRAAAGPMPALWAGLVLVVEPFVLRNNSRVFLETPGELFVLAGLLVLVHRMRRPPAGDSRPRPRRRARTAIALFGAGLLFGLGILTKDVFAVQVLVPVVLAGLWRATLRWRQAAAVLLGAAAPYLFYLVILAAAGQLGGWWWAKQQGVRRLIGVEQTTGFNADDSPSLAARLLEELPVYGVSYLFLLLCPVAGIVAARSRRPERRFIGLVALVMGSLGGFLALFGTFEEHFGYPVVVSSVLALAVAAAELTERRPRGAPLLAALGGGVLVLAVLMGGHQTLRSDDGFRQLRSWVDANLPAQARVGVTSDTGEWAFSHDPRFGTWATARMLADADAGYVVTESRLTEQGYTAARPELIDWLEGNATPVFRTTGPSSGDLVLWQLPERRLDLAAGRDVGGPTPEVDDLDLVPDREG